MITTKFECLTCGDESLLEKLPAKCPKCGGGNGLLREIPESAGASLRKAPSEERPE
jgi:Zn finger protein HypA/HybF involved in hydrogenase expression